MLSNVPSSNSITAAALTRLDGLYLAPASAAASSSLRIEFDNKVADVARRRTERDLFHVGINKELAGIFPS